MFADGPTCRPGPGAGSPPASGHGVIQSAPAELRLTERGVRCSTPALAGEQGVARELAIRCTVKKHRETCNASRSFDPSWRARSRRVCSRAGDASRSGSINEAAHGNPGALAQEQIETQRTLACSGPSQASDRASRCRIRDVAISRFLARESRHVRGVHRKEMLGLDLAFVLLGFELRNAHADQGAADSTDGGADRRAAERGHDRARGHERPEARDGERADTDEPAQSAAEHASGARSRRGPFGRLGVLLVSEVTRAFLVGEEHGNVVRREAGGLQVANDLLSGA